MKIFVSYAREDRELVQALASDLDGLDHEVWFDQHLKGGQDWWEEILAQLRACDVYIYALSPHSIDSKPCAAELAYAGALGRTLLPIMVSQARTNFLPPVLAHAHFVDYTTRDVKAGLALAAAINRVVPAPLPDPLPPSPDMPVAPLHELKQRVEAPSLDRPNQLDVLDLLEREGAVADQANDVAELLRRLRNRPDIYADIRDRVDATMSRLLPTPTPRPAPPIPGPDPGPGPIPVAAGDPPPWTTSYIVGMVILSFFSIGIVGIVLGIRNRKYASRQSEATLLLVVGVVFCFGILVASQLFPQETTT